MDSEAWEARYQGDDTPWDLGAPTPEFVRLVKAGFFTPGAALIIPGSGSGYDAVYAAVHGLRVTAVEFAASGGERMLALAKAEQKKLSLTWLQEDFFQLAPAAFDFFWEYTFYCAIAPEDRAKYARQAAALIKPGGKLAGLFFPLDGRPGGPPFSVEIAEAEKLFSPYFTLEWRKPENSVKPRLGKEMLGIFTRR